MIALPLWQPWATLIALGHKRIETRSWAPPARIVGQRIAIHACKGGMSKRDEAATLAIPEFAAVLDGVELPRGAIVATARLVRYRQFDDDWVAKLEQSRPAEVAFGDYTAGRYGWIFDEVRPLAEPVPATGRQGVFPLPMGVIEQINGWDPLS